MRGTTEGTRENVHSKNILSLTGTIRNVAVPFHNVKALRGARALGFLGRHRRVQPCLARFGRHSHGTATENCTLPEHMDGC